MFSSSRTRDALAVDSNLNFAECCSSTVDRRAASFQKSTALEESPFVKSLDSFETQFVIVCIAMSTAS